MATGPSVPLVPNGCRSPELRDLFPALNGSNLTQEVEVSGRRYTLTPKSTLTLAATAGTPVLSQSVGRGHREGEILFAVQPTLRNKTVTMH